MFWTDDFLDAMRQAADPPADEAVAQLVQQQGLHSSRQLFDRLIREIEIPISDLPHPLHDFVKAQQWIPSWADQQRVAQAYDFFVDHGPKCLLLLYFKSLPLLYTDQKGAKVLANTGRLLYDPASSEIFTRRIAETGQFLLYVMRRQAFVLDHQSVNIILKVRLIHAAIRHFIRQGEWDQSVLGLPVNQEDMALTLMTFSIAIIDGLHQLGIKEEDHRMEAYLHHWNIVGNLLGVSDQLLPQNLEEARFLLQKILSRQAAASEDGRLLTQALLRFSESSIPGDRLDISAEALILYFIGQEKAGMLGLTPKKGCTGWLVVLLIRLGFSVAERWEDRSASIHYRADHLSRLLTKALVGYFSSYKDRYMEVPEEFASQWLDSSRY